jgi:adenylate cyclase
MHTSLANVLFKEQKVAYLLVDEHLTLFEQGGDLSVLQSATPFALHCSLLEIIPELIGSEDLLQEVLNGDLPRFELENLNRVLSNDEVHYLNVILLPHRPHPRDPAKLLVILADISAGTQIQQTLTQQRNELGLLKQRLDETNKRLEYILQHYVPREVGKALMENRIVPRLGGEALEVTALFADLRNYTSISERLTPAETIEILHICLDIACTAITESGGVIVNYMGDAVMAIFNAPDPQVDHAKRAVTAGLRMQAMAQTAFKERNRADNPAASLYFGVGINTGQAVVGNVGAQGQYQYTAIGDAINVASRICGHARPSEVLIGENTYHYVSQEIRANPLPPMKFKGKSQEMTVYQVTGLIEGEIEALSYYAAQLSSK